MIDYSQTQKDLYEDVASSKNILQSWFHDSRNKLTDFFVNKYYKTGEKIVDLGCGNVLWNSHGLPVVGVDVNEGFLDLSMSRGRLAEKIIAPVSKTTLPDNYADVVVITEVLEHLDNLGEQVAEIKRILKPGGIVVCSVPYDTVFSLWKPLFAIQCFYRGKILGDDYYKQKCGHVNNFSRKSIKKLFLENDYEVIEQHNHSFFTIFTIVRKKYYD
jgi:ubiquinone/menaquinone biosynthesis C-methylase UbiE